MGQSPPPSATDRPGVFSPHPADARAGWWGAEPMRARAPATILLFTGVGLTAYTALQCVPMPIGLLAAIAPHNAEVLALAAVLHPAFGERKLFGIS